MNSRKPATDQGGEQGEVLLPLARASIARCFGRQSAAAENAAWLQQPGACFVTLTRNGHLRGCIGSLEAHRRLLDDLKINAWKAAFRDWRFLPLLETELDLIRIEVSLLSPLQDIEFTSEQDALAQLQPGIDGVVFSYSYYCSTFLPVMWERLPGAAEFMATLKRKAGLPADFWAGGISLQRYSVSKWSECRENGQQ